MRRSAERYESGHPGHPGPQEGKDEPLQGYTVAWGAVSSSKDPDKQTENSDEVNEQMLIHLRNKKNGEWLWLFALTTSSLATSWSLFFSSFSLAVSFIISGSPSSSSSSSSRADGSRGKVARPWYQEKVESRHSWEGRNKLGMFFICICCWCFCVSSCCKTNLFFVNSMTLKRNRHSRKQANSVLYLLWIKSVRFSLTHLGITSWSETLLKGSIIKIRWFSKKAFIG